MDVEKIKMMAKTFEGLEDVLGRELMRMGADDVETDVCTVTFTGDKELLYKANYELRTALKIYKEILNFDFENTEDFYSHLREYRWSKILNIYKSFKVETNVNSEEFAPLEDINAKISKLICDYFNEKSKKVPPKNNENPAVVIVVNINAKNCQVCLDSSGESLSKRGYRVSTANGALNEVFAAGLVQLSGWKANTNLIDPMCGSGTILIEAAMYAYNIPAQVCRETFGFFTWRDFDANIWQHIKNDAKVRIKHNGEFAHKIIGCDVSENAFKAAQQNIKKAILDKYIKISNEPIDSLVVPENPNTLIFNPPAADIYRQQETDNFLKYLGTILKKDFKGSKIWINSNYSKMAQSLGMTIKKEHSVFLTNQEYKLSLFE